MTSAEIEALPRHQRQQRMNIRNFLLVATIPELQRELEISQKVGDEFRAICVQELLDETSKYV